MQKKENKFTYYTQSNNNIIIKNGLIDVGLFCLDGISGKYYMWITTTCSWDENALIEITNKLKELNSKS